MRQYVVRRVFEIQLFHQLFHQEDAPCVGLQRVRQGDVVQASQCACHSAMIHSVDEVAQGWFYPHRVVQLEHSDVA
jgi:hypothetical protein